VRLVDHQQRDRDLLQGGLDAARPGAVTWSFISAISGDTTSVAPGSSWAASW
jgi:hypothetical protein